MRMTSRTSLLALMVACSGGASVPRLTTTTESAEVIAVPLTAVSAEIAANQIIREDMSPPWSLTASDGSGLLMTRVEAKAVFEGPLAFTELHLYFYNAEDRVREGTFQITLPQNAAVSRFAMETNGQMMEAEVVEKQIARRAYDDFLHRRQDPALLEKAAGNQFTAKVFPIAGRAQKHIVISYSQELPGAQYVLPLKGLPKTERVDISLAITDSAGKRVEETLNMKNWLPDRDFVSTIGGGTPTTVGGVAQALQATTQAGTFVAAQVTVGDDAATSSQAPTGVTIMVDTSASRALGFASYVRSIKKLVDSMNTKWGATFPVQVIAFDQDAQEIFTGKAYEFGDAQVKKLMERGAAGASDLGQALAWTAQHNPLARVLVVTDGVITAGSEGAELAKHVKNLANVKVERIDFALSGGLRDDKAMASLVRNGLQRPGAVLDLDSDEVATEIAKTVSVDVVVDIPGAQWVYPKVIPTARAGQKTTVYAKLAKPMQTLDVKVSGKTQRMTVLGGTQPLVERAVAAAEIAEMEESLATSSGKDAAQLRTMIAKKSVAARVISSQTSLLVLESDADYATYGIHRTSLADILVVGAHGIERKNRTGIVRPQIASNEEQNAPEGKDAPKTTMAEKNEEMQLAKESVDEKKKSGDRHFQGVEGGDAGGMPGGMAGNAASAGPSAGAPASSEPSPAPPPREMEAPRPAPARARVVTAERRPSRDDSDMLADSEDDSVSSSASRPSWPPPDAPPQLTGELATIHRLLKGKQIDNALAKARDWHAKEPGNVLALVGLGDALEAKGSVVTAARIYGSIIDLFPGRADMRRFAGERLARLTAHAKDLIVDTYQRAVADRPDHMTGHRLLAYALVRANKHAEAFKAILAGIDHEYRSDSYAGGERVLREDASMIGASYALAEPSKRDEIAAALGKRGLKIANRASTRFILYWETDANDVDFHIQDAKGGHAFYSNKTLPSGGELYADITTGYGPECFAIPGKPSAGPYRVSIDYYSQGPMGFGMGLLQIQKFDGKGGLTFEDRPYVIMNDHAYADLGYIK